MRFKNTHTPSISASAYLINLFPPSSVKPNCPYCQGMMLDHMALERAKTIEKAVLPADIS